MQLRAVVPVLALQGIGCTPLPAPPPTFPAAGERTLFGIGHGLHLAPATVRVRGEVHGVANVKNSYEGPNPARYLFNPRASLTHELSDEWNGIAYADFVSVGVELRHLLSPATSNAPVALTLGGQVESPLLADGPGAAFEGRFGAAAQPRLTRAFQLQLGSFVSGGPRRHLVPLGSPFGNYGVDQQVPIQLGILRPELRIEGLFGVLLHAGRVKLGLATQPYFVPLVGTAKGSCALCEERVEVESYALQWGTTIVFTLHIAVNQQRTR